MHCHVIYPVETYNVDQGSRLADTHQDDDITNHYYGFKVNQPIDGLSEYAAHTYARFSKAERWRIYCPFSIGNQLIWI